ncbi:MAG: hypothetical protein EA001_07350 [Oscillatoriales cyanobacterium]|nr:MAG: hypothetical protein EA001_07350 [Oscillatoriales cyanobacterium]
MAVDVDSRSPRSIAPLWLRSLAIGCLVLGIGLRVWVLDRPVIWHDEVLTAIESSGYSLDAIKTQHFTGQLVSPATLTAYLHPQGQPWSATLTSVTSTPEHPPLYYLLTRLWLDGWGTGPIALRSLAVVFGLALIPAAAWLAWELSRSASVVWWAIALVSLSPFHVLYAREAREYSLWAALVAAAGAALLRGLRLHDRTATWSDRLRAWWPYGLTLALGFYTSLLMAYVAIGHGFYGLMLDRGRLGGRTWAIGLSGLAATAAFGPWLAVLIPGWERAKNLTIWMTQFHEPRDRVIRRFAEQLARGLGELQPEPTTGWTITTIALAAISLGSLGWLVWRRPLRVWAFGLTLAIVPVSFLAVPDLLDGALRSIATRYWTPTLLAVQLALAIGFGAIERDQLPWRRIAITAGAIALLTVGGNASLHLSQAINPSMTKGISASLPAMAAIANQADRPVILTDGMIYHPANAIALALRLKPTAEFYLIPDFDQLTPTDLAPLQARWTAANPPTLYALNLSPRARQQLETQLQWAIEGVLGDGMAWLDRLKPGRSLN